MMGISRTEAELAEADARNEEELRDMEERSLMKRGDAVKYRTFASEVYNAVVTRIWDDGKKADLMVDIGCREPWPVKAVRIADAETQEPMTAWSAGAQKPIACLRAVCPDNLKCWGAERCLHPMYDGG